MKTNLPEKNFFDSFYIWFNKEAWSDIPSFGWKGHRKMFKIGFDNDKYLRMQSK